MFALASPGPVCTRLATARPTARAGQLAACELRHSSRLVVAASPALAWFLSEERLEVQLWLGRKPRQHDGDHDWQLPRRRDRMVGVALVDLSSLALRPGRHIAQIRSGCWNDLTTLTLTNDSHVTCCPFARKTLTRDPGVRHVAELHGTTLPRARLSYVTCFPFTWQS